MREPPVDAELASRAARLGVAVSYVDADDRPRRSSPGAIRAIVDLLEDRDGAGPTSTDGTGPATVPDDVVLVRGGRLRSGLPVARTVADVTVRLEVEHDDGGSGVLHDGPAGDLAASAAWAEQPIGIHRLHWQVGAERGVSTLLVSPARFDAPTRSAPGLAVFAPVYSLWSASEPLPAYDSLARLGRVLRPAGVGTVVTLPLYAPGLGARFDSSPYSPISRFHWNELFVPDRLLGGLEGAVGIVDAPAVRHVGAAIGGQRIDWAAVLDRRTQQLRDAAAGLDAGGSAALDRFVDDRPDVASYARYMAGGDATAERIHLLGQSLAEQSVADVAAALRADDQLLALDLPVGTRGESWETWRWPGLFMRGARIGAPPDPFFRAGQNWGLPPLNPVASRRDGHRVWYELLRVACRHAGVLRIDHVMQVHRLWWIPDGHAADDGAYVHYPADELLAVAAIVAHRTGAIVVGEDLGTVPPAVRRLLADWGLIGMYEEGFTVHSWAGDAPPGELEPVPAGTWAGIRTHDMAPLARMARDVDTAPYRAALGAELGREVGADPADLAAAMTERLRSSEAFEVVLDLDDLLGVTAAHNVPGTIGPENWSRRLAIPTEELAGDERVDLLLAGAAMTNDDDNEGAR